RRQPVCLGLPSAVPGHSPGVEFADRAAHNEEIFRGVNDQIEEGAERHRVHSALPFHCECSRLTCAETIELMPPEYDAIAANPLHFIVKPGHQIDELERVTFESDRYVVVE